MKKLFLLAAMVGTVLTGCMKNEVHVPKCETPISFEVANYVAQTRTGEFDTDETFGVDAWSYDATAGTVQIMENEVVSYDDVNNQWAPSHTYYWPILSQQIFLTTIMVLMPLLTLTTQLMRRI